MNSTPIIGLIAKRMKADWFLLFGVFLGITLSSTLGSIAPLYLNALEKLSFDIALRDRFPDEHLHLNVLAPNIPLDTSSLNAANVKLGTVIDSHIAPFYKNREVQYRGQESIAGIPKRPLSRAGERGILTARGYLQFVSNLDHHADFLKGRMAVSSIDEGPDGLIIEAVISKTTSDTFGLEIGDLTRFKPTLSFPREVTVTIVGIFEPNNLESAYWKKSEQFLLPRPLGSEPPPGILTDEEEPSLSPFVNRETLVKTMEHMSPGYLVDQFWFIEIGREYVHALSMKEISSRLEEFERSVKQVLPGSTGGTRPIRSLIATTQQKGFFLKIPLVLLITVMLFTVLFFLAMLISYLLTSREHDTALLKSRGVGTFYLFKLYMIEGMILSILGFLVAPWLSMILVSYAGKLPFFHPITGGATLPIEMNGFVFISAGIATVPGLFAYVSNAIITARRQLLNYKLQASRPPTQPAFQRYKVDIALLVIGGIIFWELRSRGALVSGGLFKDIEINEASLLAPVLFLVVVALVFMRMFPMMVRFLAGESTQILDIFTASTLGTLIVAWATIKYSMENPNWFSSETYLEPALLLAIGASHWMSRRTLRMSRIALWLLLQVILIALFLVIHQGEATQATPVLEVLLATIVPLQALYIILKLGTEVTPVWVSIPLWRMARNPLQYTWLVLLLVLITGLGILSATVGGTLEKSQKERVKYDVAGDFHISKVPPFAFSGSREFRDTLLELPSIEQVSLGYRTHGSFNTQKIQILAIEPDEFSRISWYRDDFSEKPLYEVMQALEHDPKIYRSLIPEGASHIGAWTRSQTLFPFMGLWAVLQDNSGLTWNVSLGQITSTEWSLLRNEIPPTAKHPLELVSVQIYEPGHAGNHTPGTILIDDISAFFLDNEEGEIIEDFEGEMNWEIISTSREFTDAISIADVGTYPDNRSAVFTFGNKAVHGLRGFYKSYTGDALPILVNDFLAQESNLQIGNYYQIAIGEMLIRVVVKDIVRQFPTMNHNPKGFVVTNLESLILNLNILDYQSRTDPNEAIISGTSPVAGATKDSLSNLTPYSSDIKNSLSELETLKQNPLASAGWRGMILAAITVVIVSAILGYWSHLHLFTHKTKREMSFLQSVGLSKRQLFWLLGFEHLSLAILGIALGTWAGIQMSHMMVSPLAVTESGLPVLPSFVLVTDWGLMVLAYLGIGVSFIASIILMHRNIGMFDLQSIARMGEN